MKLHASKFRSKETAAILRQVAKLSASQDGADLWAAFVKSAVQDVQPFLSPSNARERNTTACAERELRKGIAVFLDHWFPQVEAVTYLDAKAAGMEADYKAKTDCGRTHFDAIIEIARREDFESPAAPVAVKAKTHFQGSHATEAEAMKHASQVIGATIIQKQETGWCVFAVIPEKDTAPQAREPEASAPMSPAVAFFYNNAGYSYGPTETPAEGRLRCATDLAEAEAEASKQGISFWWEKDGMDSTEWSDDEPATPTWVCCAMYDGETVASVSGCDFGDDHPSASPYRRVVEAELATEALNAITDDSDLVPAGEAEARD